MDLINPEGFLVKGIKSQNKTYEKTEKKDKNLFLSCLIQSLNSDLQRLPHFLAMQKIETPNGNEKYFNITGSIEKMAFNKKLIIGELMMFSVGISDLINLKARLASKIGRKRKKLK
jgi:hypothetical protein